MFQVINKTPFQAGVGLLFDQFGANIAAAAVKATFSIPENNQPAELSEEQLMPFSSEQYFDSLDNSGIRFPADIVPGKVNTDIILNGCVYSDNNKQVERVKALVTVGQYYKQIEAIGNRTWKKELISSRLGISKPELFSKMPISCDRLYGGSDKSENEELTFYWANHHGKGFIANKKSTEFTDLPNFEHPKNLINSWKDRPEPATFGVAGPSAEHRIKYGGTYDEKWKESHCPLYPVDLDLRFFNCAQPELIADGFLKGGELVRLKNLSNSGTIEFRLPEYSLRFMFKLAEEKIYRKPNLYTIVIEPEKKQFYMVWGCSVKIGNQPALMSYLQTEIDEPKDA